METIEFIPTNYPSDLSDAQWEEIAEHFPQGPNSEHHRRSLRTCIQYLQRRLGGFNAVSLLQRLLA